MPKIRKSQRYTNEEKGVVIYMQKKVKGRRKKRKMKDENQRVKENRGQSEA